VVYTKTVTRTITKTRTIGGPADVVDDPTSPVVGLPSPTTRDAVTPRTPPPPGSPLHARAPPADLRSTPGRVRGTGPTHVPCSSAPRNVYYIPHPDEIMPPETQARRPEYFVITRGEEVGVFGNWYDDLSPVNNSPVLTFILPGSIPEHGQARYKVHCSRNAAPSTRRLLCTKKASTRILSR